MTSLEPATTPSTPSDGARSASAGTPARDAARTRAAFRLAVTRYRRQIWRQRRLAIPAMILPGIGTVCFRYLPPLVIAGVLRTLVESDTIATADLVRAMVLFVAAWLGGELCWRIGTHLGIRAESRAIRDLYDEGLDELLRRDLAFFHDNFAGSLTKRVIGYATRFEGIFDTFAFWIMPNVVPMVLILPLLWIYSPWLVVTLVVMLTGTGAAMWPFIQRRRAIVSSREEASAAVAGHVADTLGNIDAVRVFASEPAEAAAHAEKVEELTSLMRRSWDYQNLRITAIAGPAYSLTNALGLVVAALTARNTGIAFEVVFVTFTYFSSCTQVLWELNDIFRNLEAGMSEAAQFTELLLDEPAMGDPEEPARLAPRDSSIEFDGVTFVHRGADSPLFERFDLRVAPGEKVGLVGRSGGGKSTLTHLVLRLMDVDGGVVRVGGQDVTTLRQADLRSLIAYVPQEPVMFHRTLRENIAFGRPGATEAEIRAAADAAHATEFVDELPLGFDTLVGERGVKLSGGQRQRIAIARAVLRRAPILLLDEATSALDSESEALIQPALLSLMEDRTAIVIAHRLSTVQRMDRLIVLDQGRVVEQGTHAQLVAAGGTYAGLWAHQSGGFLGGEHAAA